MQIDWWTLALQAVNFLVLVWLLARFLYRPVKEVIAKREALAEQAFAEADEEKQAAEAARRRYEDDRAALSEERRDTLKTLHDELGAERVKVLEKAKREADAVVEAARASIAEERRAALRSLREEIASLAAELASSILESAGSGRSSDVALEQLAQQLVDMPDDERARLRDDLSTDGAVLTVATAAPLAPEDRKRWKERLSAGIGPTRAVDFVVDPAILGGAEIRFPHAALKLTWADQLQDAKERLAGDDLAS